MKPCSWCGNHFRPSVTYQIYCSILCREASTKEKIIARYAISRRQKRKGKDRKCAGGCGLTLSIYNDDLICNACKINKKDLQRALKQIKGLGK